jgi:hypothetical protein
MLYKDWNLLQVKRPEYSCKDCFTKEVDDKTLCQGIMECREYVWIRDNTIYDMIENEDLE